MNNKHKLLAIATAFACCVSYTQAQEFDENGLPKGFAATAQKSLGEKPASELPQKPAPAVQQPRVQKPDLNTREIEKALDSLPSGKYIGKLPEDLYLQLSKGKEGEHALKLLRKWEKDGEIPKMKFNGKLVYTHGSGTPIIIVKPVDLTDIELEEGEQINDILIGDNIRWSVTPTMNGNDNGLSQTSHIIVKAKKPNLTTSLIVTTNRRTYRMRLVSSAVFHMPLCSFTYPQAKQKQQFKSYLDEIKSLETKRLQTAEKIKSDNDRRIIELEAKLLKMQSEKEEIKGKRVDPLALDFLYDIDVKKGRPSWKPVNVYNDGQKTYIVMPKGMQTDEAPIVLIKSGGKNELVNYRLVDNKFVVDRIFEKAVMLSGVGSKRKEVEIERRRR